MFQGSTVRALSLGQGERQTREQVGLTIGATIIRLDKETVDPPDVSSAQGKPPHPGRGTGHVPGMTCLGVLDLPNSGPAPPAPEGPPDGPPTLSPDEMEGGDLGDRCPFPPDENGRYPEFCYDVLDLSTGDCLLDDIVATEEMCIMMFNQTFYDHLRKLQQEIERNRSQAINDLRNSTEPAMDLTNSQHLNDLTGSEIAHAITGGHNASNPPSNNNRPTNPRNEAVQLPANVANGADDRTVVDTDIVPVPLPAGLDNGATQADDSLPGPKGPRSSAVRQVEEGPRFNMGVLNSLEFMKHPPTGPPRKLIGHNN